MSRRWSGPAGYARIAAHHRGREAEAIARGDDTTAAEAARAAGVFEGLLDGEVRCRRCGRRLTDPTSIARTIGPECFSRG